MRLGPRLATALGPGRAARVAAARRALKEAEDNLKGFSDRHHAAEHAAAGSASAAAQAKALADLKQASVEEHQSRLKSVNKRIFGAFPELRTMLRGYSAMPLERMVPPISRRSRRPRSASRARRCSVTASHSFSEKG